MYTECTVCCESRKSLLGSEKGGKLHHVQLHTTQSSVVFDVCTGSALVGVHQNY